MMDEFIASATITDLVAGEPAVIPVRILYEPGNGCQLLHVFTDQGADAIDSLTFDQYSEAQLAALDDYRNRSRRVRRKCRWFGYRCLTLGARH